MSVSDDDSWRIAASEDAEKESSPARCAGVIEPPPRRASHPRKKNNLCPSGKVGGGVKPRYDVPDERKKQTS